MFAVIQDGSRQFRVEAGDELEVDYRSDANSGDAVSFDRVLIANGGGSSTIGNPTIDGATVEAEVVNELVKGPKLEIQKIRRRKNSRTHTGHRQKYTSVLIKAINVPGLEIIEPEEPAETEETPETTPVDDAVATDSVESETAESETAKTETEVLAPDAI